MNFFDVIKPQNLIHADTQIIFVADLFVENYVGGAELTSEALIRSAPYKVQKVHARDVTKEMIIQNKEKPWIFANMSMLNPSVIPTIIGNCKYTVLEYDYKFCTHRSIEKHFSNLGTPCDCHQQPIGDLISTFFRGATGIFWMSEAQQRIYLDRFPFLEDNDQIVLSSVFDEEFFGLLKVLREKHANAVRTDWLVLRSNSWIKGTETAIEYCKSNGLPYREISGLSYEDLLDELARAKGLVFLPPGGDTCPRIVIEAKLLGCELILNDNVQHAREIWFDTNDLEEVEQYLYASRGLFWEFVKNELVEKVQKLSGYTTTYNCVSQKYPFEQCIRSMLGFCDEVVVVDGGSRDGTLYRLYKLVEEFAEPGELSPEFIEDMNAYGTDVEKIGGGLREVSTKRLTVKRIDRDWTHPRFAVFDGLQKAEARALCTGDFCWQMDSDEVVHESDYSKVRDLVEKFPRGIDLVALPVIEYWGGPEKVRLDVTPWKWRISRNIPSITHGIPVNLRKQDENGNPYSLQGTDGCDMIHRKTGENIPFIGFYTGEAHAAREQALAGNTKSLADYENWLKQVIEGLPSVHHFSWFDLERKIKTYKNYWGRHWQSLYNESVSDTPENNMFFDAPWSQVDDAMIKQLASKLKDECGGWIWHRKWKGQKTPSMNLRTNIPSIMNGFYDDGRER